MDTTQKNSLLIAVGVVVFFLNADLSAKMPTSEVKREISSVSPNSLNKAASHAAGTAYEALAEEEDEGGTDIGEMTESFVSDNEDFEQQLEAIHGLLEQQNEKILAGEKKIAQLKQEVAVLSKERHLWLSKGHKELKKKREELKRIQEVELGLRMLQRDLEILKTKKIDIRNDINVVVGGGQPTPTGETALSTAYLLSKLVSAVKYFGPSVINYFIVNKVFEALKANREIMEKMTEEINKLRREAAAKGTPLPTPPVAPSSSESFIDSWGSILTAAAVIVPFLLKIVQGVPSFFPKSDGGEPVKILEDVLPAGAKGWRIIGGQKIPLR